MCHIYVTLTKNSNIWHLETHTWKWFGHTALKSNSSLPRHLEAETCLGSVQSDWSLWKATISLKWVFFQINQWDARFVDFLLWENYSDSSIKYFIPLKKFEGSNFIIDWSVRKVTRMWPLAEMSSDPLWNKMRILDL